MKLKWDDHGMKTPQAKACGLGSAKTGSGHWMHQRFTAMLNLPLMVWLVCSFKSTNMTDFEAFKAWLVFPVNSILMLLFIMSAFYHAVLGLQVVTEDYIHHEGLKLAKLVLQKILFIFMGVTCVFSVLKVAYGG